VKEEIQQNLNRGEHNRSQQTISELDSKTEKQRKTGKTCSEHVVNIFSLLIKVIL